MRLWRLVLGVVGLGLVAYAAYGLVAAYGGGISRPLLFAAVLVIAHETVLMPAVVVVGWLAVRVVPPWSRAAVQVALVVTLALTIVAIPMIVLAGTFPDLPSLLPRDYRRGLLIAVGVTWLVAAAAALANRWRRTGSAGGRG